MVKGETITYNGVTYEVKKDERGNTDPCGKCDLCKDFIEPFGENEIDGVCGWDCIDFNLYLKRVESEEGGEP